MTEQAEEPTVVPDEPGAEEAAESAFAAAAARPAPQRELTAKPAAAPKVGRPGGEAAGPSLDFILDLPLEVSVELGRASMLVGQLLQLGQGSVVELNKLAGEPLELLVNHKLVARGEAVVVNEKLGIRITDVIPADERVKRLG
jgi:flagellar motor switch protein FliN/FliY